MKITNAQITLLVNGVETTFTEEELTAILKEHFNKAKPKQQESKTQKETSKPIRGPQEGVPFEVNPNGIDQSPFQVKRKDPNQEAMQQTILEALDEVKKYPKRYGKTFWTLRPEKTWDWKTVGELVELAEEKGDHIANWVEQALEWAQRIQNGETWETICNEPDTANWFRLVQWKNGYYRIVGGLNECSDDHPASHVSNGYFSTDGRIDVTVPLVVNNK